MLVLQDKCHCWGAGFKISRGWDVCGNEWNDSRVTVPQWAGHQTSEPGLWDVSRARACDL